jgi:transcriptional regulator with XRE-family HTH domain
MRVSQDVPGQPRHPQLPANRLRLAEEAGMHRAYLGGIETARRNPSLRNLIRIALALEVRIAQLFEEGRA